MKLYHVAGFLPGNEEEITLLPGTQNSCGVGIYFTEEFPQIKYAGGEKDGLVWEYPFCIVFEVEELPNFYRSKNKPGRPRFRHSNNQSLVFRNEYREEVIGGVLCRVYSTLLKVLTP